MTKRWSGTPVKKAREYWAQRLPLPCFRCKKPVTSDTPWHVEHMLDRALGGSHTLENQWVSHATCNMRAGGKEGARRTNATKAAKGRGMNAWPY